MEDFSTVIWIIIILGAMFFNGIAQARKQAKKHPQQPGKHTAEAWPSWDTQSQTDMPRQASSDPNTQAEATPRSIETQTYEPRWESPIGTGRKTIDFDEERHESLEFEEPATAISGFEQAERQIPMTHTLTAQQKPSDRLFEIQGKESQQPITSDIVTEITEDFDLRKAVIYSELLKPKFSEE